MQKKSIICVLVTLFLVIQFVVFLFNDYRYLNGYNISINNLSSNDIKYMALVDRSIYNEKNIEFDNKTPGTTGINGILKEDSLVFENIILSFGEISAGEIFNCSTNVFNNSDGIVLMVIDCENHVYIMPVLYIESKFGVYAINITMTDNDVLDKTEVKINSFTPIGVLPWWIRIFYDFSVNKYTI